MRIVAYRASIPSNPNHYGYGRNHAEALFHLHNPRGERVTFDPIIIDPEPSLLLVIPKRS